VKLQEELVHIIIHAANALGWQVSIPAQDLDDDAPFTGMVIGTPEYISWVLDNGPAPSSPAATDITTLEWE
jgi:hypothetical protein